MNTAVTSSEFTPWRATKFYIPLVIQSFSQSLTYPLVASIVSHGEAGVIGIAAFIQGLITLFTIGALASGLITTGMIFCKDKPGFKNFKRMTFLLCITLLAIQVTICFPPFESFVFNTLLGLKAPMDKIARDTTLYGTIMQAFFFYRNVSLVILYNAKRSAAANNATLARIVLTLSFAPIFVKHGLVGPKWGLVAITIPVILEMVMTHLFALRNIRELPEESTQESSAWTQFRFTMPLSIGGFLLASAGFIIAAFLTRAPDPERMLPIHYVTIGLCNPVIYGALRTQPVSLSFPPRYPKDHALFWFALIAGTVLALIPMFFHIPQIAQWYFGKVQNLPSVDIPLAMNALWIFAILGITQSIRGHVEGIAAWERKPNVILSGQITYLVALIVSLFLTLKLGEPGYLMGATSLLIASISTWLVIRLQI